MKLAVTSASFSQNSSLKEELSSRWGTEIRYNSEGKRFKRDELISFLKGADAAIIGLDRIDSLILEELPELKVISKFGVGLDNIDQAACSRFGVSVGWTGGVNKLSVAEMTLGFALSLLRNLYQSSSLLSRGEWRKNGGVQLSNKTVGLIGFGFVGKEVYRLLAPFNCKILVNDTDQLAFEGYPISNSSIEEIICESDIISVHTPLTDKTKNLITIEDMRKMKQKPILINTARGGIINENHLEQALDENLISGLGIDAYVAEPCFTNSLLKRDNVFCTPHIGGNAREAVIAMGMSSISNLINLTE